MDGLFATLTRLLENSGRIKDPGRLPGLLETMADHAARWGLLAAFTEHAVNEALNTADPEAALNRLVRILVMIEDPAFHSLLEDPDGLKSLLAILGYSNYLSSLILRSPDDYIWLMRDVGLSGKRTLAMMQKELAGAMGSSTDMEGATQALRRNKYREMLRIGVGDLLGAASLTETVHDISNLAEASIDGAVTRVTDILREKHGTPVYDTGGNITRPGKFSVLGLGKLGGEELNYSSDVDLLYLYSSHEGTTTGRPSASGGYRDSIDNHRFFVKTGEKVTKLLNDRTEDGFVFRVDLRLRPEGESGEIAYSLSSLEVYYQSWGRTTDRLALLKAKPVGGFRRLSEEFIGLMEPFIYRKHLDYSALEEVGAIKEKIDIHIGADKEGISDIKLGRGGIREIEFLVQSLQLINGGRNPVIRGRNTLQSIDRLMKNGYLTERDAESLSSAYIFLRTVEHRVQLVEERQTHTLPADPESLEKLAFTMGYSRKGVGDKAAFEHALGKFTGMVQDSFDRLFYSGKAPITGVPKEHVKLMGDDLPYEEAIAEMKNLGFEDPETGYKNLLLLRDGPELSHFPDSCRDLLRQIAPRLLDELKGSPDPDHVLINLERFIRRVGARTSYYALLAQNPESIKLLVTVFGFSQHLSGLLISQPDLLDLMVSSEDLSTSKPRDDLIAELRDMVSGSPSFEDELLMMRRFRNGEILRIGLGDLLDLRDQPAVNQELTELSEIVLDVSRQLAFRDADGKGMSPCEDGRFAVVAMGKMGGREMNYSSDLDLIFLYEGDERSREYYTWAAQRMITILTSPTGEGLLYRIDMRLRPSGNAGPLVISGESFTRYHTEEAMAWEQQALIKARCVAGDESFMKEIIDQLQDLVYGRDLSEEDVIEIRRIRDRMEAEISAEAGGESYDIKVGWGGLVDIEFAVQVMQLHYGGKHPQVRSTSTMEALDALNQAGLVEEKQYNTLRCAYSFYRGIENRQHIYQDRSDHRIFLDKERLGPLAKRLGYEATPDSLAGFLDEVKKTRGEVREIFESILGHIEEELS